MPSDVGQPVERVLARLFSEMDARRQAETSGHYEQLLTRQGSRAASRATDDIVQTHVAIRLLLEHALGLDADDDRLPDTAHALFDAVSAYLRQTWHS